MSQAPTAKTASSARAAMRNRFDLTVRPRVSPPSTTTVAPVT